mmetsp:Transcript_51931/g.103206  ORF Transcript_51931/g.103206 Transcript_51931/m.103206 type:complete len:103 (-) Transcript_51931:153-461(-)
MFAIRGQCAGTASNLSFSSFLVVSFFTVTVPSVTAVIIAGNHRLLLHFVKRCPSDGIRKAKKRLKYVVCIPEEGTLAFSISIELWQAMKVFGNIASTGEEEV